MSENTSGSGFMSAEEVMATFPGRWATKRTLAASNVPGRVNVSATRAAYVRSVFEKWAAEQRVRQAQLLDELGVRAAKARAARAAKRGPKPEDLLVDAVVLALSGDRERVAKAIRGYLSLLPARKAYGTTASRLRALL